MSGRAQRILMAIFVLLGSGIPVFSQAYPTAAVTISTTGNPLVSGTMTISFNGYSESVPYGLFSTPGSIASAFAAEFSSYPASAWPNLCTIGVCAKANGSTVTFQLYEGASFGSITITSNPATGTSPFAGSVPTPTAIILNSSANPSAFEAPVTFTATVPSGATGSVVFFDGTTSFGSATVSGGAASTTTSSLVEGNNAVTAVYSGDNFYSGSVSGTLTQVVNKATTPTIVNLNPSSGQAGLAVTIIGSGFGTTEGQSTLTFSGTPAGVRVPAGVLNWSDSSITVIVPSNAATGPVVVTLSNGQTSNANVTFTLASSSSCTVL